MRQQYFIFYFCFIIMYALQAAIQWPTDKKIDSNHSFNPHNTIIVFDVDGVLLDRPIASLTHLNSIYKMSNHLLSIFCDATHKLALFKIAARVLYDRSLLKKQLKIYNGERFIDWLVNHYPDLQQQTKSGVSIAEQLKVMIYDATPKQDTIALLKKLHQQGYSIAIATNQSSVSFNRFVKQHIIPDFSTYIFVYTSDYGVDETAVPPQSLIKKPKKKYFKRFKEDLNKKGYHANHLVFIDDKYKNIINAAKKGLIGIQFKSVPQTIADLHLLGIM